jgi:hypothetical protein
MTEEEKIEWEWRMEMRDRLNDYRRANRRSRAPLPPDINVRAYEIACTIESGSTRTYGKILPEIIKHRAALHPEGLRYLVKMLRKAATREQAKAQRATRKAQSCEALADQLDDAKVVANSKPLKLIA